MGVITGLVVYILYREKNPAAAKRHLIGSVIIHVVLAGISVAAMLAVGAAPYAVLHAPPEHAEITIVLANGAL